MRLCRFDRKGEPNGSPFYFPGNNSATLQKSPEYGAKTLVAAATCAQQHKS
jgi:hypothetical protein